MKELVTTMTQKGQVTIPVEIRHLLGLKAKDKVAFSIDKGNVLLAPVKYTLETAFGAVKPLSKLQDLKELTQTAMAEHADKVMEEMQ